MGLRRIFNEWREKVDGTLTGPSIETDNATVNGTTDTQALEADKTTIGGMSFEEDDNSPFITPNTTSYVAQLSQDYDEIVIIPRVSNTKITHSKIRINQESSSDYKYIISDGTVTTGATEITVNRIRYYSQITIRQLDRGSEAGFNFAISSVNDNLVQSAEYNGSVVSSIDSVEFLADTAREGGYRIFGRTY